MLFVTYCMKEDQGSRNSKRGTRPQHLNIYGISSRIKNPYRRRGFMQTFYVANHFGKSHYRSTLLGLGGKFCKALNGVEAGSLTEQEMATQLLYGLITGFLGGGGLLTAILYEPSRLQDYLGKHGQLISSKKGNGSFQGVYLHCMATGTPFLSIPKTALKTIVNGRVIHPGTSASNQRGTFFVKNGQ